MQARRLVDLAEVGVLGEEATELGIEVAGLCVVEAGLGVPDVAGEGEAVLAEAPARSGKRKSPQASGGSWPRRSQRRR